MQSIIIQTVIMLHAAFGCMFLFLYRQHRTLFSRLMAQCWFVETVRAIIVLTQQSHPDPWTYHWYTVSDCLFVIATWWLLAGCADLVRVRLPARLSWYYIGVSLPLILVLRYLGPVVLTGWFGLTTDRAGFLSVLIEMIFLYLPITAARVTILHWFIQLWRRERMPGALLAAIFGVPYVLIALINPVQFYLSYYPDWFYFLWSARVLGFSLGSMMLVFDRQLQALREGEVALRMRTAFFEAQVDSALDGILVVDSAGKKVLQNSRMAEVWKIPPEVCEDSDDAQQVRFVTARTKNPQQFVEKVVRLYSHPMEVSRDIIELVDGRFLDRYSAPVSDKQGKCYGRIWTFRDITESRKAEEMVRHLAAFPELNPNPVLEFSSHGALVYHNPAALSMARKVGVGGIEQLLPSECSSIVAECLASGQSRLSLKTKHGRSTLSWSFYPIVDRQVVHCYVGDITDRQSLEEQLRQAQKMEAVGQLAGGVAHDFNNILTVIMGHLGLLRGNPSSSVANEIDESLSQILAAANRAAKLTSQLLAFSRRQVLHMSALDVNEVVTHLTKMLRPILGEHVSMQLDFAAEQLTFQGDAGLMEQVLVNLAVNARDAMPDGGTLKITTRAVKKAPPSTGDQPSPEQPVDYVRLSVADTGSGIAPEIRAKIFEPFFTTKEVGKGTGLGLATVFGIVQQHNGSIEVESEPGHGATFHIYLPRLTSAPTAAPAPLPVFIPRGRNELVLLVEDELSVQEMATQALRRQGYRVMTASSGRAALEIWNEHKAEVDLLLTDMIMPEGVSGQQLARQLLEEKPGLKVVYTSGYNAEIAGKELKLTDGINYLAKPYELERLFRTVRAALDHTGTPG